LGKYKRKEDYDMENTNSVEIGGVNFGDLMARIGALEAELAAMKAQLPVKTYGTPLSPFAAQLAAATTLYDAALEAHALVYNAMTALTAAHPSQTIGTDNTEAYLAAGSAHEGAVQSKVADWKTVCERVQRAGEAVQEALAAFQAAVSAPPVNPEG